MNKKTFPILLIGFVLLIVVLTACSSPTTAIPTLSPFATAFSAPDSGTSAFIVTATPSVLGAPGMITPSAQTPASSTADICNDPQAVALIDSLKSATLTSDGVILSSLVSPARGMDVALFRDGTVINYDQEHAKFLFETTFEANWGAEPGSGADKVGSFHEVVVPELVKIFNQSFTLHCNEIPHGGATYSIEWPYDGSYYSIYYPGTDTNGNLDWHTWVVGIDDENGKPYIYALRQFFWEP